MRDGVIAREVGWEEAIGCAAGKLHSASPGRVGIIASPTSPLESLYLLGKLARGVLATSNLDFPGRTAAVPAQFLLSGHRELACRLEDLTKSDTILAFGLHDGDRAPQIVPQIWRALTRGASLIAVDDWSGDLASEAEVRLHPYPHTDRTWLAAVGTSLDQAFQPARSLPEAAVACGLDQQQLGRASQLLRRSRRLAVVFDPASPTRLADAASMLVLRRLLTTMRSGKEWIGLLPLYERTNTLGALDLGVAPDRLPGGWPVGDPSATAALAEAWGTAPPASAGLSLEEMIHAAESGVIQALLVFGDLDSWGGMSRDAIHRALGRLDFLAVSSSFPTVLTSQAHLIVPRPLPGEVDGTYTNTEGWVQATHGVVPFRGYQEWKLVTEVARQMGARWDLEDIAAVRREMARFVPGYAGIASPEAGFRRPPAGPTLPDPGVLPLERALPAGDAEHPLLLSVARAYLPYRFDTDLLHSTLMKREQALHPAAPHLWMNPADARERVLRDGARGRLRSRRGTCTLRVMPHPEVPQGRVILPEIHQSAAIEALANTDTDPMTGLPLAPCAFVEIEPA